VDVPPMIEDEKWALRRAISLVTMRARTVDAAADAPSPCISVCRMNDMSGLCEGCFRTRDEIAAWSCADDESKRGIWRAIAQRMAAFQT
jgi:predicted Fe-S protein YdhL (DUF1289 family)